MELKRLVKDESGHPNEETPIWMINIIAVINSDVRYGRIRKRRVLDIETGLYKSMPIRRSTGPAEAFTGRLTTDRDRNERGLQDGGSPQVAGYGVCYRSRDQVIEQSSHSGYMQ